MTNSEFIVELNRAILKCFRDHGKAGAGYVIIAQHALDHSPAITTNIAERGAPEQLVAAALHVMMSSEPVIEDGIGTVAGSA